MPPKPKKSVYRTGISLCKASHNALLSLQKTMPMLEGASNSEVIRVSLLFAHRNMMPGEMYTKDTPYLT